MRLFFCLLFMLLNCPALVAQSAWIQGNVMDETGELVEFATVSLANTKTGTSTDSKGNFRLEVPAGIPFVCLITHVGFAEKRVSLQLSSGQVYELHVELTRKTEQLREIEIRTNKSVHPQTEVSLAKIPPQTVKVLPSAFGDFNKILATLPGVVSNNELSSTYAVRGGNYDENLVYVNQMEIYRPFLVRSGQQEGLSFVNPDLVQSVAFSSGGWQAKYGDKLSSVLNIAYKEPVKTGGSVTMGLLGGAAHVEGRGLNKRVSYVAGVRQKRSQYLLNTLDTKGEYLPRFTDVQSYVTVDLSRRNSVPDATMPPRTSLGILFSYAQNRYLTEPVSRETSFGTQDQVLKLFVAFAGKELMEYDMLQGGVQLTHRLSQRFTTRWLASGMRTIEREYADEEGAYRLCDAGGVPGAGGFDRCLTVRGVGSQYTYARNRLKAHVVSLETRNEFSMHPRSRIEFGAKISREEIADWLSEYSFTDSADYVRVNRALATDINLQSVRSNGYAQHTFQLNDVHTFTYGFRLGYWTVNRQFLFSPSVQYAFKPVWEKEVVFKLAAGIYQQQPFYRELRDRSGVLNKNLKAQRALHVIAGAERILRLWNRDFTLTTEAYYKYIWDAVAYDIENVRLRYFANNDTRAYAVGADVRMSGEFIKGAESWFSLGVLSTREDLGFDQQGYVRRPTDQRLTFATFFQDHLPNNPTIRAYLHLIYGTGLPFSPPQELRYRAAFQAPSYRRIDIGFSKVLDFTDKKKGLGRYVKSVWIGAEILNVLGVRNTLSYIWIADVNRRQYAVPNTLSARFLNLRVMVQF